MGTEIERKFLVTGEAWKTNAPLELRQGYLSSEPARCVRVRTDGTQGYLTVKGISVGATRAEYEYPIPLADANEMLDQLCLRPLIEKRRHRVIHENHTWEIDEFLGDNQGLVLAEIELESESESWKSPEWLGIEVTSDMRYQNVNLAQHPFQRWDEASQDDEERPT